MAMSARVFTRSIDNRHVRTGRHHNIVFLFTYCPFGVQWEEKTLGNEFLQFPAIVPRSAALQRAREDSCIQTLETSPPHHAGSEILNMNKVSDLKLFCLLVCMYPSVSGVRIAATKLDKVAAEKNHTILYGTCNYSTLNGDHQLLFLPTVGSSVIKNNCLCLYHRSMSICTRALPLILFLKSLLSAASVYGVID